MHEEVTYFSDGLRIAANLYRPSDWKPAIRRGRPWFA